MSPIRAVPATSSRSVTPRGNKLGAQASAGTPASGGGGGGGQSRTVSKSYTGGLAQAVADARAAGDDIIYLTDTAGGDFPVLTLTADGNETSSTKVLTITPLAGKEGLVSINGLSFANRWNITIDGVPIATGGTTAHVAYSTVFGEIATLKANQVTPNTRLFNGDITFTPKTSSGAKVSIEYLYSRTASNPLSISVSSRNISITLATTGTDGNGSPIPSTTANQIISLIQGTPAADALVSVALATPVNQPTNDGTGVVAALPRMYCRYLSASISITRGGGLIINNSFIGDVSLTAGSNSTDRIAGLTVSNTEWVSIGLGLYTDFNGSLNAGAGNGRVRDLNVLNCDVHGMYANDFCHIDGAINWLFQDCDFHNIKWIEQAAHVDIWQSISPNSAFDNVTIDRCFCWDNEAQAMLITGQPLGQGNNYTVKNTVVSYPNGQSRWDFNNALKIQLERITGLNLINNTFRQTVAINDANTTNVVMFNNIFHWLDLPGGFTTAGNCLYRDYNIIDNPAIALEANENGGTPTFVDPSLAGVNFRLANGSLGINTGTAVGGGSYSPPAVDIDGTSRPLGAGYDMGAYERA